MNPKIIPHNIRIKPILTKIKGLEDTVSLGLEKELNDAVYLFWRTAKGIQVTQAKHNILIKNTRHREYFYSTFHRITVAVIEPLAVKLNLRIILRDLLWYVLLHHTCPTTNYTHI